MCLQSCWRALSQICLRLGIASFWAIRLLVPTAFYLLAVGGGTAERRGLVALLQRPAEAPCAGSGGGGGGSLEGRRMGPVRACAESFATTMDL